MRFAFECSSATYGVRLEHSNPEYDQTLTIETATESEPITMQDPRWLTAEEQHEWRAVVALMRTLPSALDAQLKRDACINAFEYQLLALLSEAPDRTQMMSDLAALAQGSLSRLSHALSRLERAGWVERHARVTDGVRRTEAWLTDAGLAKVEETAPGHVHEARRLVVDVLTPDQLRALGEAARAISTAAASAPHVICPETHED